MRDFTLSFLITLVYNSTALFVTQQVESEDQAAPTA